MSCTAPQERSHSPGLDKQLLSLQFAAGVFRGENQVLCSEVSCEESLQQRVQRRHLGTSVEETAA